MHQLHVGFDHITGSLFPRARTHHDTQHVRTHNGTQLTAKQIWRKIRKPLLVMSVVPIEALLVMKLRKHTSQTKQTKKVEAQAVSAPVALEPQQLHGPTHNFHTQAGLMITIAFIFGLLVACLLRSPCHRPPQDNMPTVVVVRNGKNGKIGKIKRRSRRSAGNTSARSNSSRGSQAASPQMVATSASRSRSVDEENQELGESLSSSGSEALQAENDFKRKQSFTAWFKDMLPKRQKDKKISFSEDQPDTVMRRQSTLSNWLNDEVPDPS